MMEYVYAGMWFLIGLLLITFVPQISMFLLQ